MVFGWLFGEKKRQETTTPEVSTLLAEADEATNAKDSGRGESICREVLKLAPDNADAWNMLGVNLIRRDVSDPQVRTEAVVSWARALALRPGDTRANGHLQAELQFPDELIPNLVDHLDQPAPRGEDAATALTRIGSRARAALDAAARSQGPRAERARTLLAAIG